MKEDLLLYKKSQEKAAACSLFSLFREICPSLLIKKDSGRPTDPKTSPKLLVRSLFPGVDLLRDAMILEKSSDDGSSEFESKAVDNDHHDKQKESEENDSCSASICDNMYMETIKEMSIESRGQKRKCANFNGERDSSSQHLRAPKTLAGVAKEENDGIFR